MKMKSRFFFIVLIAIYSFLLLYYKPWTEFDPGTKITDILLAAAVAIVFAGLIICSVLMLSGKNAIRKLFGFFSLAQLAFGSYLTHFTWNFWLFKTPTFLDRVKAITMPFLLNVAVPIAVIIYLIGSRDKRSQL